LHICNVGTTFSSTKNAIDFKFQATSQLLLASGTKYLVEDVKITVYWRAGISVVKDLSRVPLRLLAR
jgi:predicted NAD-dependent protein-ADP-ribosyltransferase YbiA (DUF1768 family)